MLKNYYGKYLSTEFSESLGITLLKDLTSEFNVEFPSFGVLLILLMNEVITKLNLNGMHMGEIT